MEDDADPPQGNGLVAFNAVYLDENEALVSSRIVIAPFDEPRDFRFVTDPDGIRMGPTCSHAGDELVFGDMLTGIQWTLPGLLRYSMVDDSIAFVPDKSGGFDFAVGTAETVVWSLDDRLLYFVKGGDISGPQIHRYSWAAGSSTFISRDVTQVAVAVDTILVLRPYGSEAGLYFMSDGSDDLIPYRNPHLEVRDTRWPNLRRVSVSDWSTDGMILASMRDSTVAMTHGHKVILTNRSGTEYTELTDGSSQDFRPTWGPAGTVIFERAEDRSRSYRSTIMIADVETGEVTEFIDPVEVDGADGLSWPTYCRR